MRYARVTLPAFMQRVHTLALRTWPFSSRIVTFWILGLNQRFVTRCEWLTLRPAEGFLPQTSQILDISINSVKLHFITAFAVAFKLAKKL